MRPLLTIESNLPQLEKLWESAPELTQHELTASITEAVFLLEREVVERAPEGIGGAAGLRGGIAAVPPSLTTDTPGEVIGLVIGSAPHTLPIELGTKPHFVPIQPLQDWVEYKLGLEGSEAKSVAFAISRTIARRGTKGHFMFRDAFNSNKDQVEKIIADAVPRIAAGLTNEQ
ncbi:MAG: hypothetical protein R3332_08330 [Pseudohongiellaceae bacterium]|nr:hypothetical protein [Pseudohongiellaceae bacterium]